MATAVQEKIKIHMMQCMEIWGGNNMVDTAVSVTGMDAWIISQPYGNVEAGGDIHFVSMCGHGKISRFTVADVSGHGSIAQQTSDNLRSLMRKHINTLDQSRFVKSLNKEFTRMGQAGTFATALLATYFAPTDHLLICNAGHVTPLWYSQAKKSWQFLRHDLPDSIDGLSNLPLGIIEPTDYHQFAVELEKGDIILIYTDSITESKNHNGKPLGTNGLLYIANQINISDPGQIGHQLLEILTDYRNGRPPNDDQTLLVLHHNAVDPPKQTVGDMMKVMGKMMHLIKV